MSIWNKLWGIKNSDGTANVSGNNTVPKKYDASKYAVIDAEVGITDRKIHDIGAIRYDGAIFHKTSKERLLDFLNGVDYVCGHNINFRYGLNIF